MVASTPSGAPNMSSTLRSIIDTPELSHNLLTLVVLEELISNQAIDRDAFRFVSIPGGYDHHDEKDTLTRLSEFLQTSECCGDAVRVKWSGLDLAAWQASVEYPLDWGLVQKDAWESMMCQEYPDYDGAIDPNMARNILVEAHSDLKTRLFTRVGLVRPNPAMQTVAGKHDEIINVMNTRENQQ